MLWPALLEFCSRVMSNRPLLLQAVKADLMATKPAFIGKVEVPFESPPTLWADFFCVCVLLIYLSIDGDWVGVAARLCVARAQLHVFKHSGIASRGREFTHQNTTVHDATNQLLDSENEVWFSCVRIKEN